MKGLVIAEVGVGSSCIREWSPCGARRPSSSRFCQEGRRGILVIRDSNQLKKMTNLHVPESGERVELNEKKVVLK